MSYANTEEVKGLSGVKSSWIGLADDDALDAWISTWINKAEEEINDFTGTSWAESEVPGVVNTAVIRYVANVIKAARRHRAEQVMRVDDLTEGRFQALQPADTFLTKPIQDSLLPYIVKHAATHGGSRSINLRTPLGDDEISPVARATFGDWSHLAYRYPRVINKQVANRL